jgi:rare lipoprotein A
MLRTHHQNKEEHQLSRRLNGFWGSLDTEHEAAAISQPRSVPPAGRPKNLEMSTMRFVFAALTGLACAFAVTADPAAAAARWSCNGPEFVCGATGSAASATADERPARRSAKNTRRATAAAEAPAKATKPAKRAARVRASDDEGSGYRTLTGKASYYWQPQRVASGGWFNPNAMTAAHKSLPFGTRVRVTNKVNGRSVVVTINDRGPYIAGRIIDLSSAAAGVIGMKGSGVVPVSVAILGRG